MSRPRPDHRDPGHPDLLALIRNEIRAEGPIPFSRFQDLALYHAELGYYSRGGGIGRDGADFWTAPEMSPVFGDLVGVQIEEMFHLLGQPEDFHVLEVGAGTGALADGLLSAWAREHSPLDRAQVYIIREASPVIERHQRERLRVHRDRVTWQPEPDPGARHSPRSGVVLMNEVLDALPVDRVVGTEGGVEEIRVGLDGDDLVEVRCPASPELRAELLRVLPDQTGLIPGQEAELRPDLGRFLEQAAASLGSGYLLIIDYGMPSGELYHSTRRNGTLLAYHRHRANDDVLARVGHQDLTAHVDLTALAREAGRLRFAPAGCTTQMRFLLALGLGERIEALELMPLDETERTRRRLAMADLIRPGGMGEIFKVWGGVRHGPADLRGFR